MTMYIKSTYLLELIVACFLMNCHIADKFTDQTIWEPASTTSKTYIEFRDRLQRISDTLGQPTVDPHVAVEVKEFREMQTSDDKYCLNSITLLSDTTVTNHHLKILAIDIERRAADTTYYKWFKSCAILYDKHLISDDLMFYIIIAPDWNNFMEENISSASLRKTLTIIKNRSGASEKLKRMIDSFLE